MTMKQIRCHTFHYINSKHVKNSDACLHRAARIENLTWNLMVMEEYLGQGKAKKSRKNLCAGFYNL